MQNYLFVYGTLRSGQENPAAAFFHQHARLVGQGLMAGRLFDLGEYTGAVYDESGDEVVHGEVFQMMDTELVFKVLDEYEGIGEQFPEPHEYVRARCEVACDGQMMRCWVYLVNRSGPLGPNI